MIRISVPPRERRALLIGSAILVLGLLFGRGIPAARRWDAEARDAARETVAGAARARAEVAALPALRDSAAERRRRLVALAPRILEGRTAAGGGASLAALVAGAAARAEVQLGPVEVRYDSVQTGRFVAVRVHAEAIGALPGLMKMLSLLEAGPETLRIPEWSLSQGNPGGPPDQPEALRLELAIEGLTAPEEAAP